MLKLFSDRKYLPQGHKHHWLLADAWGEDYLKSEFITDLRTGKNPILVEFTDIENCDFAFYPTVLCPENQNEHLPLIKGLAKNAGENSKKVIVFYYSDFYYELPTENTLLLRASLSKSNCRENDFPQPMIIGDYVEKHLAVNLPFQEKTDKPTISFCGDALWPTKEKGIIKKIVRTQQILKHKLIANKRIDDLLTKLRIYLTKKPGTRIRTQSILSLIKNKNIETNFLIRDGYYNNINNASSEEKAEILEKSRIEFIKNILESAYVLCPRGAGNFSFRFYEALCLGRIPVFINTDSILPFSEHIDWKKICVWVEEEEIHKIGDKVLEYHNSLTENEFLKRQKECRGIWLEYFSAEGFVKNFKKLFDR